MTLRVALYADPKSRVEFTDPETAAITRAYRRVFGNTLQMQYVHAEAVRSGIAFEFSPHVFVLPGVFEETNYYPVHIGQEGYRHIRRFLENGGVLDAYCAGAYSAAQSILWQPSWGVKKTRGRHENLSVVAARAFGPIGDYCLPVAEDRAAFKEGFHRVDPVPVILDTGEQVEMAYGFGPGFDVESDKNITVRARYADIDGMPPAIIESQYGRGYVVLNGVLPQYTYLQGCGKNTDPSPPPSQSRLLRKLYKHREALTRFGDNQLKRIGMHHTL